MKTFLAIALAVVCLAMVQKHAKLKKLNVKNLNKLFWGQEFPLPKLY